MKRSSILNEALENKDAHDKAFSVLFWFELVAIAIKILSDIF